MSAGQGDGEEVPEQQTDPLPEKTWCGPRTSGCAAEGVEGVRWHSELVGKLRLSARGMQMTCDLARPSEADLKALADALGT